VDDLKGFIAWLKANPGEALMGTSGVGSVGHIHVINFQTVTGTQLRFVPYRGIAPAMQDLVAGQIDMMITSTTDLVPQARAGTIKALALTNDRRNRAGARRFRPCDEVGLPGFYTQMWHALWAPAGTRRMWSHGSTPRRLRRWPIRRCASAWPTSARRFPPRDKQTTEALGAHHMAEIEQWWADHQGG